ncbi:hypothetical protein [Pseudomonas vranovensis]|uniref:Uncharacterized protein n=1 Tax=Pseudomonas vranovensis TaxID=321661 RepID=A0A423D4Z4_9PSED|nr:hypothetical protein [Pseudomonas vranovensis]ROL66624.1 hypothetical protein BHU25_20820 [Pseudomonas vranovensis]
MPFSTQSAFDTYARNIHFAASNVMKVSRSKLNEALARGYGYRTYASLCSALKDGPLDPAISFDHAVFQSSVAELESWSKVPVLAVLAEGLTFDIEIEKWPTGPGQRNNARYEDIAYHVVMNVSKADGTKADAGQPFTLPMLDQSQAEERFRIDSGYAYRVTDGLYVSRFRRGSQTLRSIMKDGRWGGEAFIYGFAEQQDDSLTLGTMKSGLAKSILPTTSNRVICGIYHPDSYDLNARRIEITLDTRVLDFLHGEPLVFKIPPLDKRFFVMDDNRSHTEGIGVIVNGFWGAVVNSNGIDEAENPTSLDKVRVLMQIAVEKRLSELGFNRKQG